MGWVKKVKECTMTSNVCRVLAHLMIFDEVLILPSTQCVTLGHFSCLTLVSSL